MNNREAIKEYLRKNGFNYIYKDLIAKHFETSESNVRKVLVEMMQIGIVYYPVRTITHGYRLFLGTRNDVRHIESEMHLLTKSMATMYFKRLYTYKKLLKAHAKELQFPTLLEKMEQLELIFGEIAEMEGKQ